MPPLVFISFRVRESLAEARLLREELKKLGIATFISEDDIKPGQVWRTVLAKNLQEAKLMVVLATVTYGAKGTDTQGTMEELLYAKDPENSVSLIVVKMCDRWQETATRMELGGQQCIFWKLGDPVVPAAIITAIRSQVLSSGLQESATVADQAPASPGPAAVSWDDIPDLTPEGRAVLQKARIFPAVAKRFVEEIGFSHPDDLADIGEAEVETLALEGPAGRAAPRLQVNNLKHLLKPAASAAAVAAVPAKPTRPPSAVRVSKKVVSQQAATTLARSAPQAPPAAAPKPVLYTSTDNVSSAGHKVRLHPSTSASQVGTLQKSTKLLLVKVEGNWGKVDPSMLAELQGSMNFSEFNIDVDGWTMLRHPEDGTEYWTVAAPVTGTSASPKPALYTSTDNVSSAGHKVRLHPSTSASQVGTLQKSTKLLLVKVEGNWGKVDPSMLAELQGSMNFSEFNIDVDGWTMLRHPEDGTVYWTN